MKHFDDFSLPGVGLRMVKSAIVVFLSLSFSLLRDADALPFQVAIAAVLCIQPSISTSKQVGLERLFGTLVGGFWGSIVLLINLYVLNNVHLLVTYAFISAMMILVIYTAVALHKPSAVFLSCVVFLVITISPIGDIHPFVFVFNRMFDTVLGVTIAMVVNVFFLPKKDKA